MTKTTSGAKHCKLVRGVIHDIYDDFQQQAYKIIRLTHVTQMTLRGLKEYAQAEGVLAGFGVDLESASDLSRGIRVSEMADCWEKVPRTSARPHVDLIPGRNGTGMRLIEHPHPQSAGTTKSQRRVGTRKRPPPKKTELAIVR